MNLIPIKIDDIYEVEIIGLENEGSGVCKVKGITVFVPKALIGEKARIRIVEIKKTFARGKVIEILEPSKNRIKVTCPYYEECGGCDLRHQSDEENLKFKKQKVETALNKIGKINTKVEDVIPSSRLDNYRNKASFKVEKENIGFYGHGTYQLVDIKECMLLEKEINDVLEVIRKYLSNNENEIKTITIKHGNALEELLVDIYSVNEEDEKIVNYLLDNVKNIKTIIFNGKAKVGNGYISQISNGLLFNCSFDSFFQVNSMQAEVLYKTAIDLAKIKKSDTVLDLYCGTGTITSIIAGYAKKVIGIELVEDAIIDANCNIKVNNLSNVSFICGDAAKEINKINETIDIIFVDPPRKGVDRKAIAVMKKLNPKKIVYISCNPVTMARDLSYLTDMYDVKKVVPVDMFPKTNHTECITLLELKK